ncbi:MAG TPA: PIG-L family deacetylase, partial [Ktedonobacterales bacterium]
KPDVVICQDPTVRWSGQGYINHPDHRAAGEATLAAIMPVASKRLAFPELAAEGLETHNVREIYISGTQSADRWVNIEGYVEKKIAALRAHVSQLGDWDPQEGVTQWAKDSGAAARKHGHDFTYAEGFKYIRMEDD